ncbi:MAG: hypothetical protein ACMXYC_01240 [Candidatus Woesearchaeota archaeon]
MNTPNFNQFDARRVKKFMYHLIEVNRKAPAKPSTISVQRHVGELFKHSYKATVGPQAHHLKVMEQTIAHAKQEIQHLKSVVSCLQQEIEKIQPKKKPKKRKKLVKKDTTYKKTLQKELEQLKTLYAREVKLHGSKALQPIQKKIDALEQKITNLDS